MLSHPLPRNTLKAKWFYQAFYQEKMTDIHEALEKAYAQHQNVTVVKHQWIKKQDLRDKKHLNEIGVKRFAQNLKRAYFKTSTLASKDENNILTKNHHPRRPTHEHAHQRRRADNHSPSFFPKATGKQYNQYHTYPTYATNHPYAYHSYNNIPTNSHQTHVN